MRCVGLVDRKLVKQTVMTSVYGVTAVGARAQVEARLRERGALDGDKDKQWEVRGGEQGRGGARAGREGHGREERRKVIYGNAR